ncbi:hypothetical protein NKR23_g11944 [Pleurostoma richardsiae]|uniref:Uncharacterized protein n=1 Tax=Pleurostoma richardsiae TaxID=41990 RepID=A0AA38RHV3_9PEZI|nr:hypothetical protein NKR23_g11944 [Pleurostoma richardsiae]
MAHQLPFEQKFEQQGGIQRRSPRGPHDAREAREAARAAKNGADSRYRRAYSPPEGPDDFHSDDHSLREAQALLARAQAQQGTVPIAADPLARNARSRRPGNLNRGGLKASVPVSPTSEPPSYPGPPVENNGHTGQSRPAEPGRQRLSTAGSQGRRPSESGSPRSAPKAQRPQSMSMMADPQQQQRRPPSPSNLSAASSINRLNSPSINKIVLQPLEQKIHEYDNLMEEATVQMMQLDEEIRALQERRRQAEEQFSQAKSKHDEYERQHEDVSRALRGELMQRSRTPPPPHRMSASLDKIDSYDDRPMSGQSGKTYKSRGRGFRLSLFK